MRSDPRGVTDHVREETNGVEAVQARGSRLLEFGSGSRAGKITRVVTSPMKFKSYTVHASQDEPQYEIKIDTTDHIAMHKCSALRKLGK